MDSRLILLKLFLNEVGIADDQIDRAAISKETAEEHRRMQRSVYLMQRIAKVDLGYRFGWYPKSRPAEVCDTSHIFKEMYPS